MNEKINPHLFPLMAKAYRPKNKKGRSFKRHRLSGLCLQGLQPI